ncbi:MAG: HEAT repeat domain-containing protein, partial [Myxococcota bacterium]|nr:HEAT repeat domain-containing protein [Myxococcota bacterium]
VGCGRGEEPSGIAAEPTPETVPQAPEPTGELPPEVLEALKAIHVRQQCNRVMGCTPAIALFQAGTAAVPAMIDDVTRGQKNPDYGTLRIVDLLGQLDDDRALPVLHAMLSSGRWEARATAALAVARLKRPESRELVESNLQSAAAQKDLPAHAALLLAADRLKLPLDPSPRTQLTTLVSIPEREAAQLNPGPFSFVIRIIREARLRGGLNLTRLGATHINRFIRLEALQTLGVLKDTVGIPYCISRLDDELPSVRRTALGCLQQITGTYDRTEPEAWKAWCESRNCREAYLAVQPSPPDPAPSSD